MSILSADPPVKTKSWGGGFTLLSPHPRPSPRGRGENRALAFPSHPWRMLASAHSVSENGAPAAGLSSSQKARLTMALARRSAAFKRALFCFDNQVANDARFAVDGRRRARLSLGRIYVRAAN